MTGRPQGDPLLAHSRQHPEQQRAHLSDTRFWLELHMVAGGGKEPATPQASWVTCHTPPVSKTGSRNGGGKPYSALSG